MSAVEYYQVYDKKLDRCDLKIARPNHVPSGYYFGIVDIITYNLRNHSFLITRRSKEKGHLPGYLEVTVGCMQFGEEPIDAAKRELLEETGIKSMNLMHCKTKKTHHALAFTFLAICDIDSDSIVLQEGETEEYYWYNKDEFIELWNTKYVVPYQAERIKGLLGEIFTQVEEIEHVKR